MKLKEVISVLDTLAPAKLAESWDNVGLLAGDPRQTVRRALLTIDLTAAVLAEARQAHADLIIAYHPPIFEGLKKITPGPGPTGQVYQAIRQGIAIYALHTALDVVPGGVNDALAEIVGIKDPQPLQPAAGETNLYKLVVFVPPGDLEQVGEAIWAAGAGEIGAAGKYSRCSFRTRGTGTFQCGPYSQPAIGRPGSFEQVEEVRLETVVPANRLGAVIKAMLQAHSYEEPAYDILPMFNPNPNIGMGRVGDLDRPASVTTLITRIKKALKVKTVGLVGPARRKVVRAAVGAGSCGSMLRDVIRQKCDFYLTGELKHHHALELQEAGITTVCVGHSHSERFVLPRVAGQLRKQCPGLNVNVSRKDRDPINWQ